MRRVSLNAGSLLLEDLPKDFQRRSEIRQPDRHHDLADWLQIFQPRAMHELLFGPAPHGLSAFLETAAALLRPATGPSVWIESSACLYPPALGSHINRLYLLRPQKN